MALSCAGKFYERISGLNVSNTGFVKILEILFVSTSSSFLLLSLLRLVAWPIYHQNGVPKLWFFYRKVGIYLKKDKLNKIITNHLNKDC